MPQLLRALIALTGPGFGSQNLHGSSQPSTTLFPQNLVSSFGLHGHHACKWCAGKIPIDVK